MKARLAFALAFAWALGSAASASESANYSLTPLTIDAGGRRATSQSYTLDSSTAPGGAGSSADYTSRHGYAGSLFDVVGLDITASPLTLHEGATRQLGASLLLDDASLLSLAPAAATWSVQSGPLTGINSGGLATASIVYQNTNATVRGSYQSLTDMLTLSVLDVNSDDFGLYAGDGVADDWQVLHFGTDNPAAGPMLDPDNDGWVNLFEYNAGLVPIDPLSVFHLREETVPGQPDQRRIIFSPQLPGRTYTVQSSLTMEPESWSALTGGIVSDNGDERTVTDPNATEARKFYRIEVQKP